STELTEVLMIWQTAFEWTYYDQVLAGLQVEKKVKEKIPVKSFQAMFCIDDRECSFRRYLEKLDPACETFGTPGFFGVEFYFQPDEGKFYTKLCPAPVTPKYLIKELGSKQKRELDPHFSKHTHSFYSGWLISQTLGFWSALKLFVNIFRPRMSPSTASSFRHMDKFASLTIENESVDQRENDLQIGFTIEEMATRVENLLKSIGLVKDFASLVYVIGHGSSSVNNPHFAAYDCGACSGRAGSVNSRAVCFMANHPKVREILSARGITIPNETQFVGGLHDTTRDDIIFFDENSLSNLNLMNHNKNEVVFFNALDFNSKERSRRFVSINTHKKPEKIHEEVRVRSVSLFEPRPELNHATNTLCIIGRRDLTKGLFLDRRSFLNSYDYSIDPEGKILFNVMKPVGPVCGGINLEYFFSRVDNQKLGAGTKLPHNVMGLFGVANGIDGDLRPGLPSQMIEVHDPVRLLVIVEQFPDVLLNVVQRAPEVYEWFINEWVNLVAINPETHELSLFKEGKFYPYQPLQKKVDTVPDISSFLETHQENLPVYAIS
ncbi:MAG TPA: putative inorganic carbon transporter subunit DabA, partial [Cyclobacteriaceae bacterium]|nr:putative inorganic carbon transporter subunit DabA [Cyclobacteriaceae bacterium]